jgi:dihydrofolate synthase/folylpolyglutamate synthase
MFDNLQQAEAFLSSRESLGIKPGLERVYSLLQQMGNPEKDIRAVHIAGTNGKGSTLQFIKEALQMNGYHTGVFTSPTLEGLTGYIYHNDLPLPASKIVELCNELYPAIKKLDRNGSPPTEFEIVTVLAFMYLAKNVDIALIEAGMGGRLDTTNCFDPLLSIITTVSIDHKQFLGSTISEIAYHKAGIIKRNRPVVIGAMSKAAYREIEKEAAYMQSPLFRLGHDFNYRKLDTERPMQRFIWNEEHVLEISMQGEHQIHNAAVAFRTLMLLEELGYPINIDKAGQAFQQTQLFGRFEILQENPVVILDGAHNVKGIEAFTQTVTNVYQNRKKHLIFAVFKDKEMKEMLELAIPHFASVTLTPFDHPRSATLEELKPFAKKKNVMLAENWKEAITSIKDDSSIYFISGSLAFIYSMRKYLAGEN